MAGSSVSIRSLISSVSTSGGKAASSRALSTELTNPGPLACLAVQATDRPISVPSARQAATWRQARRSSQ